MDLTNFWQRVDEKRKQGYTDTDILNGLSKNSPEFASKIEKSRQRYSVDKIQNDRDLVNFMSQGYSGKMPTVASVPVKTEQPEKPKVTIDRSSGILGSIAGGATDFLGGIAQGAKKGVASSMLGMASLPQQAGRALAEKITGQKSPEQFKTVREIADKTGMLERKGTAEAIGFGAEQLGEFIVPSGAISKFGKGRGLLARMATEAATFGGITAVQTGEVGEEAKTSALIGAAIPAVGTGLKVAKKLIRPAKDINGVVGEILQGSADDIVKGKKAFSKLDVSGVKNYNQLAQKADERIGMLAGSLDDLLSKKPNPIPLNNLQTSVKVGGKTVAHNYVDDALNQLDELYKKTNDPVMVEKVAQIRNKAQTQGLNLNNLNDLAKAYGEEFGNKAFSKRTGEALTSVNAQSFENTRKGVKEVARKLYGGKEFEAIDREMTNLIRVRKLSEDVAKKANELKQKVEPRGIGAATGRKIFNTIDTLTGGSISGFIRAAGIPRGAGYKTMNAIDLELKLNKNLKLLKSLEKSLEQKNVISQRIFGGTNKLLTESEKKALRKMPMGMSVKDIIKDPEMKKKVAEVFKHNLKMQVERTSPEAGAIVSKLDFAKANSIQEMMTIVKKALPTNLRNNPAISSAIKNWGGSAEQVKNVLPIKSFKQGVVPKTATGNIKPVSKPSLIQEAKKLFHHTDVKIGNVLKAGKPSVKNYFGEGIYATNTKGGYPGKFIKEFQTPEGLKTLDLTKKGADDKFLNEVSKITKTPLEKTGMGVYEDLRLMASKSSDDIIRKAVDKITKGYEVIKSPLGYEGQFETVIRKSILPIKKVSKPLVKPSLIQKAKKYKTAEEFVKAGGIGSEVAFIQGGKAKIGVIERIEPTGIYINSDKIVREGDLVEQSILEGSGAKFVKFKDIAPKENLLQLDKFASQISKQKSELLNKMTSGKISTTKYKLELDKLTKSQLETIWNKAKGIKKQKE